MKGCTTTKLRFSIKRSKIYYSAIDKQVDMVTSSALYFNDILRNNIVVGVLIAFVQFPEVDSYSR